MKNCFYVICLSILFLSSCIGGFGFIYKKHLFGNYYLTAPDAIEQCALTYDMENDLYAIIIDEIVFAVGFNDRYIIAKQCKISYDENYDNETVDSVRYYIFDSSKGADLKNLLGPFTLSEFIEKRAELNISDIQFSIEEPVISKKVKKQSQAKSK